MLHCSDNIEKNRYQIHGAKIATTLGTMIARETRLSGPDIMMCRKKMKKVNPNNAGMSASYTF